MLGKRFGTVRAGAAAFLLLATAAPVVADAQQGKLLYRRMNDVCNRILGTSIRYAHAIESDEMVLQAMRKYQPVMTHAPGCAAARDFRLLAEQVDHLPAPEQASGRIQFFMERMLRPWH